MIPRIGDEVQRLSVVNSIPDLLLEDQTGCISKVFPKMQQVLPNGSAEFHVSMSQTMRHLVTSRQISMDVFCTSFLASIVAAMDNRDHVVANTWCDTLVEILDYLPLNNIQADIIPLALARAQITKSVPVRISSCRIIGKIISRLDPVVAKKDIVPTVLSLCQDISGEVRASMASQLDKVILHLGAENSKTGIISCLIELNSDEFRGAKEAAYGATVTVAHLFPSDIVKHTFIPLINQMLNLAFKSDDYYIAVVSSTYGTMCTALKPHTTVAEKEAYLKWFSVIAESGMRSGNKKEKGKGFLAGSTNTEDKLVMYRQNCAQNIPQVVQFCWDETNDRMLAALTPTMNDLISDPFFMVRRTMASNLFNCVKILDKSSFRLRKEFLSLLRDDSEEVLEGLMPNLSAILMSLLNSGGFKKDTMDTTMIELNRTLTKCEGILSSTHNWRLYTMFLKEMEVIHKIFPTDVVFNTYISLFFKRLMTHRAVPIRLQALRSILVNLRHLNKVQHRTDVRNKIINDLRMSFNFYDRMIYIRACDTIMEVFSTSYFKEFFFSKTISLVDDPVANIRWGLCRMLPKLKAMTKVNPEKKYTNLLDGALAKLSEDKDKEVQNLLNSIKSTLDRADPTVYFPRDAKLLEEENAMPSDLSKNLETRISVGATSNLEAPSAPQPSLSNPPAPSSSTPPSQRKVYTAPSSPQPPEQGRTSSTTTTYPRSPSTSSNQSGWGGCLSERESGGGAVVRGGRIPVRRPPPSNHATAAPSPPTNNNRCRPPAHKRHSVHDVGTAESSRRQSHLPRPLSCINFPPKSDGDFSKPRPVSRLPVVVRQRM